MKSSPCHVISLVPLAMLLSACAESKPLLVSPGEFGSSVLDMKLISDENQLKQHNSGKDFGQSLNIGSLPLGEAMDLFYRFGFFSLSVRVVPRDDPGQWLIREPTVKVFQSLAQKVTPARGVFDTNVKIYLCDDTEELEQAFFSNFKASGVSESYKLFTGSWHDTTRAKYFGLSKDMFDGDSSFVLIKMSLDSVSLSMANQPTPSADTVAALSSITTGDENSISKFIEQHGSHFIEGIEVGDSVYQVLALKQDQYQGLKSNIPANQKVLSAQRYEDLFNSYLAPWLTRESGQVLCASGTKPLQSFLDSSLKLDAQFGSYPHIFALQGNTNLQEELNVLGAESTGAVIGMNFEGFNKFLPDLDTQTYYDEIMKARTSLWESNIA
eukprot:maker-scaffold808_size94304-snap-gene-0.23 protein:Tk09779 transcript:maker-scaffold808_size94304-snap-gene-0.23-mRNA-1 annotation:"torso-like protein precursor"